MIHLRSESVPLDAMSNMLHIFAHLAQDEEKLNDAEDILKYGIFVKDNVSKLLLRRKNFINKIFKEIVKRFGINIKDLEFLSLQEINILIKSGKINKQLIKNRRNFTVIFFNGKSKILEGKSGHNFVNKGKFKEIFEARRSSVKGFGASLGKVRGKCVVAENFFMAKAKMKKGSILIVPYTGPEYLPVLKLAKAVVTDTGGITSHAAIVSRELKIPCVIGTKIATKVFKDGDLVEIDANKGIVKIIK